MKDYYEILGMDRQATAEEIKKAFRSLAMVHHPDRNPADRGQAEEKFKEINQAYQVLGDSTSRWLYDQTGMSQVNRGIDSWVVFRGRGCGRGMGRGRECRRWASDKPET